MPAFGGQLSDAEVAAVLTYVRSAWGNDADPVPVQLVTELRGSLSEQGMLQGGAGVNALAP
jgi:mono/diheme cytochrome c family protein